ncbi:integral membrane protein [Flavobacteriaceae bacterium MAR_2010_188]|nr:integral membrane protein [Flavobacteriaceae bacterium MAR_2010_188]
MKMTLLGIFKVVAFLEGISYILLLFIAVPIKYMADDPTYVKLLGMPHGILFIGYIILALLIIRKYGLSFKSSFWLLAYSLIPIAAFFAERKIVEREIHQTLE